MHKAVKVEVLKTLCAGAIVFSLGALWKFIFDYKNLENRVRILEDGHMEFHVESENDCLIVDVNDKYFCILLWEKQDET